jgi:hypothetical protein
MILGAIVLVAGAAGAAAYFASPGGPPSHTGSAGSASGNSSAGGNGGASGNGSAGGNGGASGNGSASGSQGVATAPPATPPTQARVDPAPGDPPLTFKQARVHLSSTPSDAEVKDLSNGKIITYGVKSVASFKVQQIRDLGIGGCWNEAIFSEFRSDKQGTTAESPPLTESPDVVLPQYNS